MGLIALVIVAVVVLILMEMFKHHFTKGLMKYAVMIVIILIILMFVSAFVDLGSFFAKDNTFSKTGKVVADDVSEDVKKIDFSNIAILDSIEEKSKELVYKLLE